MTRAELEALAERVEREEPNDDLNWAVGQTRQVVPGEPRWLDYTTSLDAAVTLVPVGWIVSDLCQAGGANPETCQWFVQMWTAPDEYVNSRAKTEAQARTAAALRARAQEAGDE